MVVGHGSQSMMGLSIDSSSVAMNLRIVRISESKKHSTTRAGNNKDGSFSDSCGLVFFKIIFIAMTLHTFYTLTFL